MLCAEVVVVVVCVQVYVEGKGGIARNCNFSGRIQINIYFYSKILTRKEKKKNFIDFKFRHCRIQWKN